MVEATVKFKLLEACRQYVDLRLQTSTQAMNNAQEAANAEGKSSAGDKYETGRAMMQIERDTAARQVEEALKLKRVLDQIDPAIQHHKVSLGSLVITSLFRIYVTIGAGKIDIDGEQFVVVAPESPLAKTLLGKVASEHFTFNNQAHTITRIL